VTLRPLGVILRNALLATVLPNLVWIYLSWRHKLGVGAVYVWPWVLITTVWYACRADRLGLDPSRLGAIAYDWRSIRVAFPPFVAAVLLSLLNFALSPQAPPKSPPIVLIVSGVSWYLNDIIAYLPRWTKYLGY
jgi:hypothetical protein